MTILSSYNSLNNWNSIYIYNCSKHNVLRLSEEIFYKDILEENVFQYFHGGGLVQQLYKDKRRAERNSAREQFFSKQPGIFHHLIFLFTLGLMKSFDLFPFYVIVFTLLINWLLDFIDWLIDWLIELLILFAKLIIICSTECEVDPPIPLRVQMLDVGSCYNPFYKYRFCTV